MFLNKIEHKQRKKNESVYNTIAKVYGNTPKYSDANYAVIAKEGYGENFVFFRCLTEICKAAIQGEWKVMKKQSNGKTKEILNHPVLQVLNKPNPLHSKAEFITRAISFKYLGGEAPIQKIVSMGRTIQLLCYRPDKVSFEFTADLAQPYKNIKYLAGSYQRIEPKFFTLWKAFNPCDEYDGLGHGMALLQPALKSGDLLNSFIDWNVSLLQNGASPCGAWITEEELGQDSFDRMNTQIKNKHVGTRNVGKPLLLEGGMKWQKMGENPKDMDWAVGKESTIVDICSSIGPDPILIGYGKYSSYNNKKEAKKDLYTSHVIPLMQDLAGLLTNFLELADNEWIEMDYSHVPVMQEDENEKSKRINEAKDMTINEKRQARGLDEIEGGDIVGDAVIINGTVYIPMNLVPAGEEVKPKKEEEEKGLSYEEY
jgi:HK97 family phage portal protein